MQWQIGERIRGALPWAGWPIVWRITRWAASALFLALVLLIYFQRINFHLPVYRYQINPDGVGYMSVAQHWLHGQWAEAVNAYWSPLYSWLMVPLLACGFDPLVTTKLVSAFAGAIALASAWRLGHHMGIRPELRAAACLAMVPFIVYYALIVITPDLLVAAMILAYLAAACSMASDSPPARSRWFAWTVSPWTRGLIAGLLAGLCYLAKAYALPVVIGHFLLMGLVRIVTARGQRLGASLHVSVGLLIFALIVGAWSAALTAKFGQFMTGSTGRYNYYLNGPKSTGQPMSRGRLIPPPNPSAFTMWEDPTSEMPPAWSPFHSLAEWDHQMNLLDRNWTSLLDILREQLPGWPVALAAGVMTMLAARHAPRRRGALAAVAMAGAYPLGYMLLHVEERFLMIEPLLLILIGVQAIGAVSMGWWWVRWPLQWIAVALILWSPIALPARPRPSRTRPPANRPTPREIAQTPIDIPPLIDTPGWLQQQESEIEGYVQWAMDRSIIKRIEQKLARPEIVRVGLMPKIKQPRPISRDGIATATMALWGKIPAGSRVASVGGGWDAGAYVCFNLALRHYGATGLPSPQNDVEQQWIDYKIEYVFWDTRSPRLDKLDARPIAPGVWRITLKPPPPPPATRPATTRATAPATTRAATQP